MHCPVCGAESTQGLNYCKRCGAAMNAQSAPPPEARISLGHLTGMFWAIAIFGIGSISALVGGALGAVALGAGGGIAEVTGFGFLVIFGICWLLTRQLSRIISAAQVSYRAPKFEKKKKRHVKSGYDAPQIAAPPYSAPSVTEHTTRNFDPAAREESEHSR